MSDEGASTTFLNVVFTQAEEISYSLLRTFYIKSLVVKTTYLT